MKRKVVVEMINGDTREWVVECDKFDFGSVTDCNFFILLIGERRIMINRDKVFSIDVTAIDTVEAGE